MLRSNGTLICGAFSKFCTGRAQKYQSYPQNSRVDVIGIPILWVRKLRHTLIDLFKVTHAFSPADLLSLRKAIHCYDLFTVLSVDRRIAEICWSPGSGKPLPEGIRSSGGTQCPPLASVPSVSTYTLPMFVYTRHLSEHTQLKLNNLKKSHMQSLLTP